MKNLKSISLALAMQLVSFIAAAQDSTLFYSFEFKPSLCSATVPFLLRSNQYGSIPEKNSFVNVNAGIYQVYNPNNPRFFQWSGGIQIAGYVAKNSSLFLKDFYLAGKAGPVELMVGQRPDWIGLGDTLLSSGSVAMSQNFRPYPRFQLSTPQFTNLVPGSDFITYKFSYSDGSLGAAPVNYGAVHNVPQTHLHHKSLYFRLGGLNHKLNLFAGFNHQAIWGGESKIWNGGLEPWAAYKYVIVGKPWFNSRVGNHFGTIDLAAKWSNKNWNFFAYRQNIYEDGSLANLSNIVDGLNGLRLHRNKPVEAATLFTVNTILIEFLYTKSQGGSVFDFDGGIFGNDNYFNHYVYVNGWSYKGRSLGTPLIGPTHLTRPELPSLPSGYTNNNRIMAVHLGLQATTREFLLTAKGTLSLNSGTYSYPFSPAATQASVLFTAEKDIQILGGCRLGATLTADLGQLYPTSGAVMFSLKKFGFLNNPLTR